MLDNSWNRVTKTLRKIASTINKSVLDDELMILVKTKHGVTVPMTTYQFLSIKDKTDYELLGYF